MSGIEPPAVVVEIADGVAWLTLDRPDSLNALSAPMIAELTHALEAATGDPDVRCVVLTGSGRAFSAGGDYETRQRRTAQIAGAGVEALGPIVDAQIAEAIGYARPCELVFTMPKPVVAMINGHAVGGGLSLALACDFRVMARSATLRTGFATVGLPGDFGITHLLSSFLGAATARRLLMLSPAIDADEALRLGLVTSVEPDAHLRQATGELAATLAAGPTFALAQVKHNLAEAATAGYADMIRSEARRSRLAAMSADAAEGMQAMRQRRSPDFSGR